MTVEQLLDVKLTAPLEPSGLMPVRFHNRVELTQAIGRRRIGFGPDEVVLALMHIRKSPLWKYANVVEDLPVYVIERALGKKLPVRPHGRARKK